MFVEWSIVRRPICLNSCAMSLENEMGRDNLRRGCNKDEGLLQFKNLGLKLTQMELVYVCVCVCVAFWIRKILPISEEHVPAKYQQFVLNLTDSRATGT